VGLTREIGSNFDGDTARASEKCRCSRREHSRRCGSKRAVLLSGLRGEMLAGTGKKKP